MSARLPVPLELAGVNRGALKVLINSQGHDGSEWALFGPVLGSTLDLLLRAAAAVVAVNADTTSPPCPPQDFLLQFSRLFSEQFAPGVADARLRAFVNEVLSGSAAAQPTPADLALEFKHVCRCDNYPGCGGGCQLAHVVQWAVLAATRQRWHAVGVTAGGGIVYVGVCQCVLR